MALLKTIMAFRAYCTNVAHLPRRWAYRSLAFCTALPWPHSNNPCQLTTFTFASVFTHAKSYQGLARETLLFRQEELAVGVSQIPRGLLS